MRVRQVLWPQSADIICDQCGVRVTTSDVRRSRCAHINLAAAIRHPLGTEQAQSLNALPVLPVAFIEAPGGPELLRAYDGVLRCGSDAQGLGEAFGSVLDVLAPLLIVAHQWDLPERRLIAHGMALKGGAEESPLDG